VAALWAVPLASAPSRSDRIARVCGGTVDTVNVGSRAPACPPFNIALHERGATAIQGKRPRSGRGLNWFPNPGDHIPNKEAPTPSISPGFYSWTDGGVSSTHEQLVC
jgi:hypothetical protein